MIFSTEVLQNLKGRTKWYDIIRPLKKKFLDRENDHVLKLETSNLPILVNKIRKCIEMFCLARQSKLWHVSNIEMISALFWFQNIGTKDARH